MKLLVILLIPLTCFCQQPGHVFSYTNPLTTIFGGYIYVE